MKTMCNSFYQCELNTQGHVSPVLTTCENNMKLNIATKLCEPPAEGMLPTLFMIYRHPKHYFIYIYIYICTFIIII